MTKKEKIIATCFTISMISVLISAIVTIYINKPINTTFLIEKLLHIY